MRYCIRSRSVGAEHRSDFELSKDIPYIAPHYEYFEENWPYLNGTTSTCHFYEHYNIDTHITWEENVRLHAQSRKNVIDENVKCKRWLNVYSKCKCKGKNWLDLRRTLRILHIRHEAQTVAAEDLALITLCPMKCGHGLVMFRFIWILVFNAFIATAFIYPYFSIFCNSIYHACWCTGSISRQCISRHAIDCVGQTTCIDVPELISSTWFQPNSR